MALEDLAGDLRARAGSATAILNGAGLTDLGRHLAADRDRRRLDPARAVDLPHGRAVREEAREAEEVGLMIRESTGDSADFERCVEIVNAVEPDNPTTVEHLREAATAGSCFMSRATATPTSSARVRPATRWRWCACLPDAAKARHRLGPPRGGSRARDGARPRVDVGPRPRRGVARVRREARLPSPRRRSPRAGAGRRRGAAPGVVQLRDEHRRGPTRSRSSACRRSTCRLVGEARRTRSG